MSLEADVAAKLVTSPCPFCGSEAEASIGGWHASGHGESSNECGVHCLNEGCGAEITIFSYAGHKEAERCFSAVERWNRRLAREDPLSPRPMAEAHIRGALDILRGVGYGEMPEDRILHRDTLNELELHLQKALSEVME